MITQNQKGFAPTVILLFTCFLIIVGAIGFFYFNRSHSTSLLPQQSKTTVSDIYINTTLGLTINLPDSWDICDGNVGAGFIGITPPPVPGTKCSASGPYSVTTAKYYSRVPGTLNQTKRQSNESFIDYVKRLDQSYFQSPPDQIEYKSINPQTVLATITDASLGSPTNIMYLENSETGAIIITLGSNGYETSNLSTIASSITTVPITTGDITGQMSAQVERNNTFTSLDTPTNYPVRLYGEDRGTVISTTNTNFSGIYTFRVRPGIYNINDSGTGWKTITVSTGDIQIFNGGTIIHQ